MIILIIAFFNFCTLSLPSRFIQSKKLACPDLQKISIESCHIDLPHKKPRKFIFEDLASSKLCKKLLNFIPALKKTKGVVTFSKHSCIISEQFS